MPFPRLVLALCLALPLVVACSPPRFGGGAPAIRDTPRGVLIAWPNGAAVRLEVATESAFRVSAVGAGSSATALPADGGTFIDPALPVPARVEEHELRIRKTTSWVDPSRPQVIYARRTVDNRLSLVTAYGRLEIELLYGAIELRDAAGKLLYGTMHFTHAAGKSTLFASYPTGERAYGIGNGPLVKTGAVSGVFNTVTRAPVIWTSSGYGILVRHEKPGVDWNRGERDTWTVPDPVFDVYLFTGSDGYGLLDAYTKLTGRPPVPPRWTFGYLQSRWGFKDAADIRDKWRTFRERRIPVDAFIYDYDWYNHDWVWNPRTFPDPAGMMAEAKALGIRTVGIRKPRVTGANLEHARTMNWVLARGSGGPGYDIDFSIKAAREWWWAKHVDILKAGMAGWWNDEAEQALTEYFWMVQAQVDGQAAVKPGTRPWTINRTYSPGIQRLGAAVWTGDIGSSWHELARTPQTLLSYGLCGIPYACADTGGFRGSPDAELFARWQQQSALTPLMRAHGRKNSSRWPWGWGAEADASMKKSIELRYRLVPYLYSLAHWTHRSGAPLMRPLVLEFPADEKTHTLTDQWMLGPALLCAPFFAAGGSRSVYFPGGNEGWYAFDGGPPFAGGQTRKISMDLEDMPLYVRGGSILPLAPVMQHTGEAPLDLVYLDVYPGADTDFHFIEDDGESTQYLAGKKSETWIRWTDLTRELLIGRAEGDYAGKPTHRTYVVRVFGQAGPPAAVRVDGAPLAETKAPGRGQAGWNYDRERGCVTVATPSLDCGVRTVTVRVGK